MKFFPPPLYARSLALASHDVDYSHRRLHPACQAPRRHHPTHHSECLTAISVPMPMPKTKQSMTSGFGFPAITPFRPRAAPPSDRRQHIDRCYIGCFISSTDVSTGFTRKQTNWVWRAENGEEYTVDVGNLDGNARDVGQGILYIQRAPGTHRSKGWKTVPRPGARRLGQLPSPNLHLRMSIILAYILVRKRQWTAGENEKRERPA